MGTLSPGRWQRRARPPCAGCRDKEIGGGREREVSGAKGKKVTGKESQLCVAPGKNVRDSRDWGGKFALDSEEGLVGLN